MNTEQPNQSDIQTATEELDTVVMPVSKATNVGQLAGKLMYAHKKHPDSPLFLRYIGAAAAAQAIKSIIIFNIFLSRIGKIAYTLPSFSKTPARKETTDKKAVVIVLQLNIELLNKE